MFSKTFYYGFIPSKVEEEALKEANMTHKVTKTLIEIGEAVREPINDPNNPWVIKKVLTPEEVVTKKIIISFKDTFDHIFKYWSMEMADQVVKGNKLYVVVLDTTAEVNPTSYRSEEIFFETGPEHEYFVLGCMDVMEIYRLRVGDEIGMFWDIRTGSFQFRVLKYKK